MQIREIFKSFNIAATKADTEHSAAINPENASIWSGENFDGYKTSDIFESAGSTKPNASSPKPLEEYSEEVLKKACDGEKLILLRNVPEKVANKIKVPEGYKAEYFKTNDGSIRIEFVNMAETNEDIWAGRLNLGFKNGLSVNDIGPTSQRYLGKEFFGITVPKNYQHSCSKSDDGLYMHSFTLIKANEKSADEIIEMFNQHMLNGNTGVLSLRNLTKETLNKIKVPEGFTLASSENEYGYFDITIVSKDDEKTYQTKLKHCFSLGINAMNIGPISRKEAYKSGDTPYSVKIPAEYHDEVRDAGNGKYYHNFIYIPKTETNKEENETAKSNSESSKINNNNFRRAIIKKQKIKTATRYGRGYSHTTGGSTACRNKNKLGPGTRQRQRYNRLR